MKRRDIELFMAKNSLKPVELATYFGVTRGAISQIVSGKTKLSPKRLKQILNNPHGWDTSMLVSVETKTTENGKVPVFKVVDTVQQNSAALKNKAQELLIQDYQRQIADKDATIQELCKQIGMLEAKIELLEKGDITPESV